MPTHQLFDKVLREENTKTFIYEETILYKVTFTKHQQNSELMKRQNMGRGEDRISNLPDPILQSILCMMPLKSAIRTSTLSKRWRNLWEYSLISSTTLEFGNEFSCNQSPKQFMSTLSRYLHIHESEHVEKFRILFSPFDLFFRDIETWIGFAVSKGVKQLDIDLSQGIMQDGMYIDGKAAFILPNSLFECKTLTNLSLSRCDIASPFDMSGFRNLRQLTLSHVNITNDMLERMLVDCRALESLSIKSCLLLSEIRITGPELGLQKLIIMDCFDAYDLEISAPKLQSLIYYGWIYSPNVFNNISSLVDACIYSIGRVNYDLDNDNIARWISDLSHVKVLTLCSVSLMGIAFSEEYGVEELPIELQNLQELQLVMDSLTEEHLSYISAFFQLCPSPFLEKLFIQLPGELNELIDVMDGVFIDKDSPGVLFNHLKVIKVTNFRGFVNELRLVKFLLEKAVVLESLVLVTPQDVDRNEESNNCQSGCEAQFTKPRESLALKILRGQLLLLSKASNEACIVLREFSEDDHSLNPTHSILYTENVIQVSN